MFDHQKVMQQVLRLECDERLRRSFAWARLRSFVHMSSALSMGLLRPIVPTAKHVRSTAEGARTSQYVMELLPIPDGALTRVRTSAYSCTNEHRHLHKGAPILARRSAYSGTNEHQHVNKEAPILARRSAYSGTKEHQHVNEGAPTRARRNAELARRRTDTCSTGHQYVYKGTPSRAR